MKKFVPKFKKGEKVFRACLGDNDFSIHRDTIRLPDDAISPIHPKYVELESGWVCLR